MKKLLVLFILILSFQLNAQSPFENLNSLKMTYLKGASVVAPDSSYSFKFKGRMQSLFEAKQSMSDGSLNDDFNSKMMVRRARLKFDGWALDPSIVYKVELGISNRTEVSACLMLMNLVMLTI